MSNFASSVGFSIIQLFDRYSIDLNFATILQYGKWWFSIKSIILNWNSTILLRFCLHFTGVLDVDFVERGRNVVSCSRDGTAKLWDVSKQKCLHTYQSEQGGEVVNSCALHRTEAIQLAGSTFNSGNHLKVLSLTCLFRDLPPVIHVSVELYAVDLNITNSSKLSMISIWFLLLSVPFVSYLALGKNPLTQLDLRKKSNNFRALVGVVARNKTALKQLLAILSSFL